MATRPFGEIESGRMSGAVVSGSSQAELLITTFMT
jgi:hypothetical protein